ncbi:MAG: Rieske (2Fe-2S) protein [Nocardioidaceae bacterium]
MTHEAISRRQALAGAAVAGIGLPLLAACSSDAGGSSATDSGAPESSSPASGPASSSGGGSAGGLAATSDIEVGGAVFLEDPNVVITQPTKGDFHAFDRTCTHAGCPVADIVDGNIHCPCHNSMFSMTDGSPVSGPAPSPLKTVAITVQGGEIVPG